MALTKRINGADETPITIIRPSSGWRALNVRELWEYRDLLYFLTWRDIKVRYKQTVLGATWAVLQPFFTMVVFSIFFGRLAGVPSDGIPYPLFAFAALVPWTFFASGLTMSTNSMVSSANMIKKVYFPRLALPIASIIGGVVDFLIAFAVLFVMILGFKAANDPYYSSDDIQNPRAVADRIVSGLMPTTLSGWEIANNKTPARETSAVAIGLRERVFDAEALDLIGDQSAPVESLRKALAEPLNEILRVDPKWLLDLRTGEIELDERAENRMSRLNPEIQSDWPWINRILLDQAFQGDVARSYRISLTANLVWLPLLLLLALITSLGAGMWLSAMNVQFRDVRFAVPFLVQAWLFATPIAYASSMIENQTLRALYALNPMAGVVEGFRWALLGMPTTPGPMIAVSFFAATILFVSGAYAFRRMERNFADVA